MLTLYINKITTTTASSTINIYIKYIFAKLYLKIQMQKRPVIYYEWLRHFGKLRV